MADKPLDKMTVKELKEIAKEIPDLTGIHSMKKDELLAAIMKAKGGGGAKKEKTETKAKAAPAAKAPAKSPAKKKAKKAAPKVKAKPLSPAELKKIIVELREEKLAAQQAKDKKQVEIIRKKINRMKKMTRKPEAQKAKPVIQPKEQPAAEPEAQAEAPAEA